MSKFIIECPACHRYAEAKTGFFARKKINCDCGNVIDVRIDRMTDRVCPSCGNTVIYDQAQGTEAKCPVCHAQLVNDDDFRTLLHFKCKNCGFNLRAKKTAFSVTCPICDTPNDVQLQLQLEQEHNSGETSLIRYEGDNNTFVWKHPNTDFINGARLIVHEGQAAIFIKNGLALDVFSAGSYTLAPKSMPLLNDLSPLPPQGQPFYAEVYFVNLATHMNIKWGTNSKVGLFDPATGIHVDLGASGSFNLRVTDPGKLVTRLVGTADGLSREQIFSGDMGYFRTMVMTKVKGGLAKAIKENSISILELDEHVEQISAALKVAINRDLVEYGLTMPEFYVVNILTPDDDPNFRRMKQQHADVYLKVREEQIKKAEAEAAFERKAVEAQTDARMKVIGAQGEADIVRIKAQAEAEAYRMKAEAEAQEMRMKGYTYQQETARQVSLEALKNAGDSMLGGIAGDVMQMGIGLGTMNSVISMTKDVVQPAVQGAEAAVETLAGTSADTWDCACGRKGLTGRFCPECGAKKPVAPKPWNCVCGQTGLTGKFCPNCGNKRPETWDCACGRTGLTGKFCPECGRKRED